VLAEAQGVLALVDDYYDGLHGAATRPLIGDPENIALYRAQLQYKTKTLTVTAGRQRIGLDNDRFVDTAAFRQSAQTYDAVRVEWTGLPRLRADVTYAWSVRTVWGVEGVGARPQAISGNSVFAELGYTTKIGAVTGFAYLADLDEAAVQSFRLSSQTYGVRLTGARLLGPKAKLSYEASYARQSDYHRNPSDYTADFYQLDAMLDLAQFKLGAGYEVAGASKGAALTSFQYPVGTGFRWRGWAGKLNPTPPDGLHDLYGTIGYGVPKLGKLSAVTVQATYHRFESDRLARHYGDEIDLLASTKLGKYTFSLRYAGYGADKFATDTSKAWAQLDWTF
jgi:hypothetical protein